MESWDYEAYGLINWDNHGIYLMWILGLSSGKHTKDYGKIHHQIDG